jgi:hypothetical protein
MRHTEFTPPIHQKEITSVSTGPEGHVSSMSLLLSDANSKLFSLHVATEANHVAASSEYRDEGEFPEPVFVVPTTTIDDDLLEKILTGTNPEVLGLYLVPQEG